MDDVLIECSPGISGDMLLGAPNNISPEIPGEHSIKTSSINQRFLNW